MLNLFAGEQADRFDLQRLIELHRERPGLILRGAGDDGPTVAIMDDGEPSTSGTVTTLLRLAAVGSLVLGQNTGASALTHLNQVFRRAEDRDRLIASTLEGR